MKWIVFLFCSESASMSHREHKGLPPAGPGSACLFPAASILATPQGSCYPRTSARLFPLTAKFFPRLLIISLPCVFSQMLASH